MNVCKQYCPTFTRWTLWLWNSPTFTTWGNYGVQSLRLILVTPLLLTRFNETEIAAWYLFASLNFFGMILSQRLGLTFSRMFAFAMGGASNLAPIKGRRPAENDGQPNWQSFERAYGTIGSINLGLAWLNVLVAAGMGWFGLSNLLAGYEAKGTIWLAFALMQVSSLLVFIFQRWAIALQGMNYIALVNRWGILFGVLSCLGGSLTLALGGGLISLVVVMQLFGLVGILRNRFLLGQVEEGRVLRFRSLRFDKEVFGWAWVPTWKGFVGEFGQYGSLQLTAVIYTGIGAKSDVAAYLFALRMMQTVSIISQAPFNSVLPLMSRLRAAGELLSLRKLIIQRAGAALGLLALGILVGAAFFPWLLDVLNSSLGFVPIQAWLLFGGLTLLVRINNICCAVSAIGNEMIYYWHSAIAGVLGAGALFFFKDPFGIYTPILAAMLPSLLVMNVGPCFKAKQILQV